MSDSATPVQKAEHSVEKAQAVLGGIDVVLQDLEKAAASTRGRKLLRIGVVLMAAGLAFVAAAAFGSRND